MPIPVVAATQIHNVTFNAATSGLITFSLGTVNENDVIMIHVAIDGDAANPTASGYTTFAGVSEGSVENYFLWKRMGATPDSDVTINWTGNEQARITLMKLTGVINSGDILDAVGSGATGAGPNATPTSPASTVVDTLFISAVAVDRNRIDTVDTVSGTGWTEESTSGVSGGANGAGSIISSLDQASIGTPADPTFSLWASDGHASIVFNIKPSAGAALLKLIDESENLDDVNEIVVVRDLIRLQNSVLNLVEAIVSSRVLIRLQNSILNLAENITKSGTILKLQDSVINLGEIISTTLGKIQVIIDGALNISEIRVKVIKIFKLVDETEDLVENVNKTKLIVKIQNSILNLVENITSSLNKIRLIQEVENFVENITKTRLIIKIQNSTLNIVENITKVKGLVKFVNETMNIVEEIVTKIVTGVVAAVTKGLRSLDKGARSLG